MYHPKVSIVCAYYNREDYVTDSVQSLLDQNYDNLEIIIINDGSTDSTGKVLEEFNDPRLKIITQDNTGFVGAIIRAVEEATGEYIAVHGSGDISYPDRISKQAQVLNDNEEVGVVGCHVKDDSKTGDDVYTLTIPNGLKFNKQLLKQNLFTHGEVMFRKNIYEKVGGYRPFFTYAQDRDLWLRMSEHCDYRIVEEVLYRRLRLDGGVSTNIQKSLLQAILSDFASHCAKERHRTNTDPLNSIGPQSALLRTPSESLSKKILWIGVGQMIKEEHNIGWTMITKALREYFSIKILLVYCVGAMHKVNILWSLFGLPFYKWLYTKHLQRSGQAKKPDEKNRKNNP